MRNVPPTPANYAQRSGRAGRSGQAALVLTYSSAQSPHDQYFFRDPKAMVHGEVRPPLLDLANRDLIDSHLQAVWLACIERPLEPSIAELLVLGEAGRPLRPEVGAAMADNGRHTLDYGPQPGRRSSYDETGNTAHLIKFSHSLLAPHSLIDGQSFLDTLFY